MCSKWDFTAIKFAKFHQPYQTPKRAVESSQYLRAAASFPSDSIVKFGASPFGARLSSNIGSLPW